MSCENLLLPFMIDRMSSADLPDVLSIEKESFPAPWTPGMFKRELESAHSRCLCMRINSSNRNIIAAYIIFWMISGEIHLQSLAVKKEYRKRGYAGALLKKMKEIALENNVAVQTLEVRESNTEAIKLYRKSGFVVKGIRPKYYTETNENALIMWADVNG
ncbi:MAG: ribosomal protein S18-alanine N-acetyltransferase [Smithella sp.]|nr:ribosomal protein S18-alanine N-acetyltransferase [Smithella sp.]